MPEMRHQRPGSVPAILSTEIHLPNDADFGTGTFTIVLAARALLSGTLMMPAMINPPRFQISVGFEPNSRDIPVELGRCDGSAPTDRVIFLMPRGLDLIAPQTVRATFANWRILSVFMGSAAAREEVSSALLDVGHQQEVVLALEDPSAGRGAVGTPTMEAGRQSRVESGRKLRHYP